MSVTERAKKLSKRDKKVINRVVDYQNVFASEEGKRVLWDIMEQGNILRPTAVSGDEISSFVNEGKRNLVLYILAQLETDAKQLLDKLTKEAENAEEEENFFV